MQIVIDIKNDAFERIKNLVNADYCDHNIEGYVMGCIANGTPLPEHHGRLIDISEYEKYFNTAIIYDDGNHDHVVYTDTIPTIIEGSEENADSN